LKNRKTKLDILFRVQGGPGGLGYINVAEQAMMSEEKKQELHKTSRRIVTINDSDKHITFNRELLSANSGLVYFGEAARSLHFAEVRADFAKDKKTNKVRARNKVEIVALIIPYWFRNLINNHASPQTRIAKNNEPQMSDETLGNFGVGLSSNWLNCLEFACFEAKSHIVDEHNETFAMIKDTILNQNQCAQNYKNFDVLLYHLSRLDLTEKDYNLLSQSIGPDSVERIKKVREKLPCHVKYTSAKNPSLYEMMGLRHFFPPLSAERYFNEFNELSQISIEYRQVPLHYITAVDDEKMLKKHLTDIDELYKDKLDYKNHGILHTKNVALISYYMAKKQGLSDENVEKILEAVKYHDITHGDGWKQDRHEYTAAEFYMRKKGGKKRTNKVVAFLIENHEESNKKMLAKKVQETFSNLSGREQEEIIKMASVLHDADSLDNIRRDVMLPNPDGRLRYSTNYLIDKANMNLVKPVFLLNVMQCLANGLFFEYDNQIISPHIEETHRSVRKRL